MKKRILPATIAVLVLALALTACAPAAQTPNVPVTTPAADPTATPVADPTPETTPETTMLTDMAGREVALPKEVKRIVSLAASNTEILYAIGAEDMLVGRDDYSLYPEAATAIPVMGDYNGPNVEAIVAAEADVVLASYLQGDVINQLTDLGIAVFCTEASEYDGIYTSIELIGAISGKTDNAAALCNEMQSAIAAIAESAPKENQPTVYYVMSFGEYGEYTGGLGSFINAAIAFAGGIPVTDGMGLEGITWPNLSIEQVVALDPDIILLSSLYTKEDLAAASGYADMRAVKEGQVYLVNPNYVEIPGPRIVDAVGELAEIFAEYRALNPAA